MAVYTNTQGIHTDSNAIIFTDNIAKFVVKGDYIDAPNYYFRNNTVFKKGSSFLFKKVAFNIVAAGTVVFDLLTNTADSSNVASIEYNSVGHEDDIKQFDASKIQYSTTITIDSTSTIRHQK